MSRTKLAKAAGRFGVRYGQSMRRRIADIEGRQRKKQACPFCSGRAVRNSKGIWNCRKCGKTFAGHTYYLDSEFQGTTLKIKPSAKTSENSENKSLKKQKSTLNKEKSKK